MPNYVKNILSFDGDPAQVDRLFIYTIQLTEAQYAALLDRAAELEIPLEDLLLQAMQNFLEESDNFA